MVHERNRKRFFINFRKNFANFFYLIHNERKKAYDIPKYWPFKQPEMIATGKLKNIGTGMCVMAQSGVTNGDPVVMTNSCTDRHKFTLSWHEDIGKFCFKFLNISQNSRKFMKPLENSEKLATILKLS